MKIRIMGTPAECRAAVYVLEHAVRTGLLAVVKVSGPYPNRGDSRQVRVYVEAHLAECGGCDDYRG